MYKSPEKELAPKPKPPQLLELSPKWIPKGQEGSVGDVGGRGVG